MDTTMLNFNVLNQLQLLPHAAGTGALTVYGNLTINIVSGSQQIHTEYHNHTITGLGPASMSANLDAIRQNDCLRDVLGILLVLNPAESAAISLVAEILGRGAEEVDAVLQVDNIAEHVRRERTKIALCDDIRSWLMDGGRADIQEYHGIVASWALSRTSSHPLAVLYAAEQWHYHVTRSRPSPQLYHVLATSMTPLRAHSYKCLPLVVQWLRNAPLVTEGLNSDRDAAIQRLEGQSKYIQPRLKKLYSLLG
ncbi:hypothetical protein FB45DRAFT_999896 [Roridomyces roridus]|uniref:Uncharacterized protein n=1 Tax=Roridomyces roridus TaxID=1738132 RepID=A0AAD7C757_9AGAR|nr:hypothetical protein FB45DRAFT_999896 [Roridomyces roridus]